MARIRTVKPEMKTSLTLAGWPREVRYAFVLLLGYLDDEGRGLDDMRLIVAECFPLDRDVTQKKMDGWVQRMTGGPICRYEVGGTRFLHAVKWREHQRISHPTPSRWPACPHHEQPSNGSRPPESLRNGSGGLPEELLNGSRNPREQIRSDSSSRARGSARKGREGKGREEANASKRGARAARAAQLPEGLDLAGGRAQTAANHGMDRATAHREFDRFVAWHGSKGSKFVDWDRAWLTWVMRWEDDHRGSGSGPPARRPVGDPYLNDIRAGVYEPPEPPPVLRPVPALEA